MNTTLDFDQAWQAVQERDGSADGSFVFGVRTTGVYCRPSCPARRPNPKNVSFFPAPEAAESAGFRACLRCQPRDERSQAERLVNAARELLDAASDESLSLTELAASLSVSAGHLQRTFKRLTGVSPRQYAEARRLQRLKSALRNGDGVAAATYEAGFGSSSRVYEKANALLGMTPGRYRRRGRGLRIGYAIVESTLGRLLVAATERGACFVAICDSNDELEEALRREYPLAAVVDGDSRVAEMALTLAQSLRDGEPKPALPLDVSGSDFQILVWQALSKIPAGETHSYGDVATRIGRPGAARAVARACATNPVALLVPCHRVLGTDGGLAGYRWGVGRKQALLAQEKGRLATVG
ncbi:MAG TPA: bifunctional DNA-binding transcriptional regulator/O6-methylguanine-DNA methyltransferase Ada [Dehalococcoidia bacterium]|nr:bifunctional DNA-binding transcriptional regulator/O6-methylguanine-DNA methyltransferase Ada [Dehalococcoidia bacterium]